MNRISFLLLCIVMVILLLPLFFSGQNGTLLVATVVYSYPPVTVWLTRRPLVGTTPRH